ncbi:MAG TPA: hypothetical protein VKA51_01090 [Rubrobacteraceae bacterium]|nr:hypothetical protein [Rubrobacteraceae bacterium]
MFALTAALVLALVGCGNGGQAQNETSGANESTRSASNQEDQEGRHSDLATTATEAGDGPQDITPLLAEVPYAPIPFAGSDGRTHLVYELETTNFTSGETTIEQLEVLDPDTGDAVDTLDAEEVAGRLQPAGLRDSVGALAPSTTALVFMHVTFDNAEEVPDRLVHRLSLRAEAAPPDQQQITEEAGPTAVDRRNVIVVGPR